jgi:hypothetical protein
MKQQSRFVIHFLGPDGMKHAAFNDHEALIADDPGFHVYAYNKCTLDEVDDFRGTVPVYLCHKGHRTVSRRINCAVHGRRKAYIALLAGLLQLWSPAFPVRFHLTKHSPCFIRLQDAGCVVFIVGDELCLFAGAVKEIAGYGLIRPVCGYSQNFAFKFPFVSIDFTAV